MAINPWATQYILVAYLFHTQYFVPVSPLLLSGPSHLPSPHLQPLVYICESVSISRGVRPACAHSSQEKSRLPPRPPIRARSSPSSQGGLGLSAPHRTPGLGHPVCGSHSAYPKACLHAFAFPFPELAPKDTGPLSDCFFFSFYPITHMCVLQSWLYQSPSAHFQLVFSENFSTCRCIFDSWREMSSTSSFSAIFILSSLAQIILITRHSSWWHQDAWMKVSEGLYITDATCETRRKEGFTISKSLGKHEISRTWKTTVRKQEENYTRVQNRVPSQLLTLKMLLGIILPEIQEETLFFPFLFLYSLALCL